jgi:HEPN domain-containing protein/predicted nucleotidyltransferase
MAIAEGIRLLTEPAMIILFGSYARGTYVEEEYTEEHIRYSYISDYDILVIVEDERRADFKEKTIRNSLRKHLHHELHVQVLVHGIGHVNEALEEGQYFFADIVKEGVMLFDDKRYKLAAPKILSPEHRQQISKMYFEKWFPEAEAFYRTHRSAIDNKDYSVAIFLLHQTTEKLFNTIELVFTHYKPKTHDLLRLYKNVVLLDDRFKAVFPLNTIEGRRLFDLLAKAYIDSRYKMDYTIAFDDLEYLSGKVDELKLMVKRLEII